MGGGMEGLTKEDRLRQGILSLPPQLPTQVPILYPVDVGLKGGLIAPFLGLPWVPVREG